MKRSKLLKLVLLIFIITILCNFKINTGTVKERFKSLRSSDIYGCEIDFSLSKLKIVRSLNQSDLDKFTKLLSRGIKLEPGKLLADNGYRETLVLYLKSSERITLNVSDKGCWFYYPFVRNKQTSCYKITQKSVLKYIDSLYKKYIVINKRPINNKFVPKLSDIDTAYFLEGGTIILHGLHVFDLRKTDNKVLLTRILDELRKAAIMVPIENEIYAKSTIRFATFYILLKNKKGIQIRSAWRYGNNQVYYDKYKLYAPICKSFIEGSWKKSNLHTVPCYSIEQYLSNKNEFLNMKEMPKQVIYSNSVYSLWFVTDEDNVGNLIGETSDEYKYKVYQLNTIPTDSAIIICVNDYPKAYIEARRLR